MRHQGKITSWKDDQGFGFITPNGGGKQVFVHIKAFANRQRRPVGSEIVTYQLKTDARGRAQAENVAFVGERVQSSTTSGRSNIRLIFAAAFVVFVAVLAFAGKLPFAVFGLYVVISIVVFIVYALDKSAARKNRRRIPENTLHLLALIGGWPGALVAQKLLHHKSSKQNNYNYSLALIPTHSVFDTQRKARSVAMLYIGLRHMPV